MQSLDLSTGPIRYRVTGPSDSQSPPVVFVHGVMVDGSLWDGLAARLADAGVRSYAPDWPLGSHTVARPADADQSPRGVARHVLAFLEALGLHDVILVGNDTGGAICQFLVDIDPSRIGRLILTNCDCFEHFPPRIFTPTFSALRSTAVTGVLMQALRVTALRHSPAGFGLLANRLDARQTRRWVTPAMSDAGVRRDLARFCRAIKRSDLVAASNRLRSFDKPALIVWGSADRAFKPSFADRLVDVLGDVELVRVDDARTFVMLDQPDAVARAILARLADGAPPAADREPLA